MGLNLKVAFSPGTERVIMTFIGMTAPSPTTFRSCLHLIIDNTEHLPWPTISKIQAHAATLQLPLVIISVAFCLPYSEIPPPDFYYFGGIVIPVDINKLNIKTA